MKRSKRLFYIAALIFNPLPFIMHSNAMGQEVKRVTVDGIKYKLFRQKDTLSNTHDVSYWQNRFSVFRADSMDIAPKKLDSLENILSQGKRVSVDTKGNTLILDQNDKALVKIRSDVYTGNDHAMGGGHDVNCTDIKETDESYVFDDCKLIHQEKITSVTETFSDDERDLTNTDTSIDIDDTLVETTIVTVKRPHPKNKLH